MISKTFKSQKNILWKFLFIQSESFPSGGYFYHVYPYLPCRINYLFLVTLLLNIFILSCSGISKFRSLFDEVSDENVRVAGKEINKSRLENGLTKIIINDSNTSLVKETIKPKIFINLPQEIDPPPIKHSDKITEFDVSIISKQFNNRFPTNADGNPIIKPISEISNKEIKKLSRDLEEQTNSFPYLKDSKKQMTLNKNESEVLDLKITNIREVSNQLATKFPIDSDGNSIKGLNFSKDNLDVNNQKKTKNTHNTFPFNSKDSIMELRGSENKKQKTYETPKFLFQENYFVRVKTKGGVLNIRRYPFKEATVIGKIPNDSISPVLSQNSDWLKINFTNKLIGWINKNYTKEDSVLSHSFPNKNGVSIQDKDLNVVIVNTNGSSLNIRDLPFKNANLIGKIQNGSMVNVINQVDDWYRINFKRKFRRSESNPIKELPQDGWINKKYTTGNTFLIQNTKILKGQLLAPAKKVERLVMVNTNGSLLNIRELPFKNSNLIGKFPNRSLVRVFNQSDEWFKVAVESPFQASRQNLEGELPKYGWINKKYTIEKNLIIEKAKSFITPPLNKNPKAEPIITIKTFGSLLNIRELPFKEATIVGKIPNGKVVRMLDRKDNWLKISYETKFFGWINKHFTENAKNPDTVTLNLQGLNN